MQEKKKKILQFSWMVRRNIRKMGKLFEKDKSYKINEIEKKAFWAEFQ